MDSINMQPIGIQQNNAQSINSTRTTGDIPVDPKDSVTTGTTEEKSGLTLGKVLVAIMGIRRPTITKEFPEEDKKKILESIQPGDIILETNDAYPGWQIFEKITLKSDFTHAAIYEGDGKFIEATTSSEPEHSGVIRTCLDDYLTGGRIQVQVIRPPYKTPEDREAALNYARSQMGKPYDSDFNLHDDSKIYCAELVYNALNSMPNPIDVPITKFFGREAVGPDNFEKIEGAEIVYSNKKGFIKSMLTHYPLWIGSLAGGVVGGCAFGPWGAVGGALVGRAVATCVGNYVQTGDFAYYEGK